MSSFRLVCLLHATIDITSGCLMMFYLPEMARVGHGRAISDKILGSTVHDQLLIRTSESLVGMCLVIIGGLLFMVSFVRDRDFQTFFAKGCIVLHLLMSAWRLCFERKVLDLAHDWPRQLVGDVLLSLSWVFLLVWNWREKYD